jgi:hypothetical protein
MEKDPDTYHPAPQQNSLVKKSAKKLAHFYASLLVHFQPHKTPQRHHVSPSKTPRLDTTKSRNPLQNHHSTTRQKNYKIYRERS